MYQNSIYYRPPILNAHGVQKRSVKKPPITSLSLAQKPPYGNLPKCLSMQNECLVYNNDKHCISDKQLINFLMPTNECQKYKFIIAPAPRERSNKSIDTQSHTKTYPS